MQSLHQWFINERNKFKQLLPFFKALCQLKQLLVDVCDAKRQCLSFVNWHFKFWGRVEATEYVKVSSLSKIGSGHIRPSHFQL